jgi:ferric-dicitrate binding protein FerR (iron transport regulator)
MNHEELAELINRYRSGTATPEEIALLDKIWAEAQAETSITTDHTEEQLQDIQGQMFSAIKNEISKKEHGQGKSVSYIPLLYKVAASILIVMAVSFWWYSASHRLHEIRTGFGEQRIVMLPDQSKVILNGNSVLRYAPAWDENTSREVWIEGEGFFSVIHTKNHQKFIVHGVNQLNVEVLGTKFNVNTRHCSSEVMLTEGKVKLELEGADNNQSLFLKPGELATVTDKELSSQSVNKQRYTSWVENKLFFERTPLRDISGLLKDTYGLNVTFSDPSLETRELSGEISATTVDEILYAIGETLDLKVEKHGQLVTISPKHL